MTQLLPTTYVSTCRSVMRLPTGMIVLGLLAFAIVISSFLMAPASALAASGHGHAAAHHAAIPPFGEFLASLWVYWFNFLFYCGILVFFGRKPIARMFAARRSAIEERVRAGERALAVAQAELTSAENRIATLQVELSRVRKEIQDETTAEVKAVAADAHARAARIVKLAEESAQAERRSIESLVEQELIQSAYLLARERLVRENSAENDRGIREAIVRRVSQLVQ